MASYIELAPFPPSFSPKGPFPDHFRLFLDFLICLVLYLDLFSHKYISQLSGDTYYHHMSPPEAETHI